MGNNTKFETGSSFRANLGKNSQRSVKSQTPSAHNLTSSSAFASQFVEMNCINALPGDLVLIESGTQITCDMLVLEGNCLVDEAVLTGESIPVTKTNFISESKLTSLNVVYAGSVCLLQRDKIVLGMVVNTGWNTFKGKIVSSLIHSRTPDSKIMKDTLYLVKFLIVICTVLVIGIISFDYFRGQLYFYRTVKYVTDLYTKGFQPTTVFMLHISVFLVGLKLKKRGVTSMKSNKLYQAGRVDSVCFDKTGTLTEAELNLSGFVVPSKESFTDNTSEMKDLVGEPSLRATSAIASCCHDLHIVNGNLVGDPVDIEVFKYSKGSLEILTPDEPVKLGDYNSELKVITVVRPPKYIPKVLGLNPDHVYVFLKIFPFLAEKKRMGVLVMEGKDSEIIKSAGDRNVFKNESVVLSSIPEDQNQKLSDSSSNYIYVCKGAPEIIKNQCDPSTVPDNFSSLLDQFAQQGLRVLGSASKTVTNPNQNQEDYEKDMIFNGFILLNNPVKPTTPTVIEKLRFNLVECAMITGDHIYTAVNIGYASQILQFSESVWLCTINQDSNSPEWKFMTYKDLLKGVDVEEKNILNELNVENASIKISTVVADEILASKFSISKRDALEKEDPSLENYEQKIKSRKKKPHLNNIIDDFDKIPLVIAMDGKSVDYFYNSDKTNSDEIEFLLKHTKIYGRTDPEQKKIVIERLKEVKKPKNLCVAFVGDGANDCKALNRADIGLSIGNSDASMASPFVTQSQDLEKVVDLLELGRYTIANFFDIYYLLNTMNLYEIMALVLVIGMGYYYANWKYIVDFFFYTMHALVVCYTASIGSINRVLPSGKLFNRRFVTYFCLLFLIGPLILLFSYHVIKYETIRKSSDEIYDSPDLNMEQHFSTDHAFICMLNTTVAIFATLGIQLSYPHKKSPLSNYLYLILTLFLGLLFMFCVKPDWFTSNESILRFMLIYARTPDFDETQFIRWFAYILLIGICMFIYARTLAMYFLYKVNFYFFYFSFY